MKTHNWKSKASLPVSTKVRNDLADYDYLHKLSPEDLEWLKGFNREYVNADFQHDHTKVIEDPKETYDNNNARNRDLYSKKKWGGGLFLFDNIQHLGNKDAAISEAIKDQQKVTELEALYVRDRWSYLDKKLKERLKVAIDKKLKTGKSLIEILEVKNDL